MLRLTLLLTFVKRSVNKCFEHLYDAKLLKLRLPGFLYLSIVTALAEKVVFEESIKESDGHAIMTMLRRVRKTF